MFIERFPENFEFEQRMILPANAFKFWFDNIITIVGYVPICDASDKFLQTSIKFNDKHYILLNENKNRYFMTSLDCDSSYFSLDMVSEIKNSKGISINRLVSPVFYFNVVQ